METTLKTARDLRVWKIHETKFGQREYAAAAPRTRTKLEATRAALSLSLSRYVCTWNHTLLAGRLLSRTSDRRSFGRTAHFVERGGRHETARGLSARVSLERERERERTLVRAFRATRARFELGAIDPSLKLLETSSRHASFSKSNANRTPLFDTVAPSRTASSENLVFFCKLSQRKKTSTRAALLSKPPTSPRAESPVSVTRRALAGSESRRAGRPGRRRRRQPPGTARRRRPRRAAPERDTEALCFFRSSSANIECIQGRFLRSIRYI